jgi:hypothetical protein
MNRRRRTFAECRFQLPASYSNHCDAWKPIPKMSRDRVPACTPGDSCSSSNMHWAISTLYIDVLFRYGPGESQITVFQILWEYV